MMSTTALCHNLVKFRPEIRAITFVIKFTISEKAHKFDKLFQFIFYVTILSKERLEDDAYFCSLTKGQLISKVLFVFSKK